MATRASATRTLHLLCAGAARGLVAALVPEFEAEHGVTLEARFGAVGAMRDALEGGALCDVIVLTDALLKTLGGDGQVDASSTRPLGSVATGVAARRGDPLPKVDSAEALREALATAPAIHIPDSLKSTAGAHVLAVLERLGLAGDTAARRVEHPNGHAAMTALGESELDGALGCTQISEIVHVPTVRLAGALPGDLALATVYGAGSAIRAAEPELAAAFIEHLCGPAHAGHRQRAGFEPVARP